MATIANYFEQAQLSLAAYALNLLPGMSGQQNNTYVSALTAPTVDMQEQKGSVQEQKGSVQEQKGSGLES